MRAKPTPVLLFLFGSFVLHLAAYAYLRWAWTLPDPGFELVLPSTIELGVVEGTTFESLPATAAEAPEPAEVAQAPDEAEPADPAPPTPEPERPEPPEPPKPSGPDAETRQSVAKQGVAALSPPGAQLALRVDMNRIRESPLAEDVRQLLETMPDVRAILDGSDIDPVRDLSRLFLASPNLQRSRVVLAGKHLGDEAVPREAAERLARARGTALEWQTSGPLRIAPWENPDSTERVLALFGSGLFAITRSDDLPRVIGIGQAIAQRSKRAKPNLSAAEALLEMGPGQLVSFTVENAKLFARGARAHVPERLVIAAEAAERDALLLTGEAHYASEAEAKDAREFWDGMRARYARSPLVALLGVSGLLERTTLSRAGARLELRSTLSLEEVRLILRFVRDSLAPRRAPTLVQPPSEDPMGPK